MTPLHPPSRRVLILFAITALACPIAIAQHDCKFFGQQAAEKFESDLENAKSCKEVASVFNDCRWGSSADAGFGATAVAQCEKEFYKRLTTAEKNNYADEMQLCAYEYARQQGTIAISGAATCQVNVAASIAANPHLADEPVAPASFDCRRAQSLLEKAICSDISLGRADIVLNRVYNRELKSLKAHDRVTFVNNEKGWLKELPAQCGLDDSAPSRKALNCLRNAFEIRFSSLDDCADNDTTACLNPDSDPEDYGESQVHDSGAPRASFDCNAPTTALQVVICDDHELGQKDLQVSNSLEVARSASDPSGRQLLENSQRAWLEYVRQTCPLGVVGGIPDIFTRGCIRSAYEVRAKQIQTCSQKPASERVTCLNVFRLTDK